MKTIETATVFLLGLLAFGIVWEVWLKFWRDWKWTANRAEWAFRTGRNRLARWLLGMGALLLMVLMGGAAWADDECSKGGSHTLGDWGKWVWVNNKWESGLCMRVYQRVASCTKCRTSRTETETRAAPTQAECKPGGGTNCATGPVPAPAPAPEKSSEKEQKGNCDCSDQCQPDQSSINCDACKAKVCAAPMSCTPYDYEREVCCGGIWIFPTGFRCTDGHKTCRYVKTCDPEHSSTTCGRCK